MLDTRNMISDIDNIEATISTAREHLAQLESKAAAARARLVKPPDEVLWPKPELPERIEQVLRGGVMTLQQLANRLGETSSKTAHALRALRKNLANVGTSAVPRWTWRIGDRTSTEELTALVSRLILEQPLTTAELVAATGARASRVGGSLVAIQRSGARVLNLGTSSCYRWFVVPDTAEDARLEPKKGGVG